MGKDHEELSLKGGDELLPLQAGLRTLHEAGPELKRAISGDLSDTAMAEQDMPFVTEVLRSAVRAPGAAPLPTPMKKGSKPRPVYRNEEALPGLSSHTIAPAPIPSSPSI